MPLGQAHGLLSFLVPTVLPLPSAASRQGSPGGPSASSIQEGDVACGTPPRKEPAASAGEEEEGGDRSGGCKSRDTPSWGSTVGGLPRTETGAISGCSAAPRSAGVRDTRKHPRPLRAVNGSSKSSAFARV